MKLDQYNDYIIITVGTDGLVLYHQDIDSHSAGSPPMHFQLFNQCSWLTNASVQETFSNTW